MDDDMWEAASEDAGRLRREAAMATADAEMSGSVMPFLLASLSDGEYGHREAVAMTSIASISQRHDVDVADLTATARRRWELYRQALAEGTDPVSQLEPLLNGGGYGSGPEKPDEHDEGPDFSHGYSEVPPGPPGGPSPQVTRPRPPMTGPAQEATGSLRRRADASPQGGMTQPYMPPPDTGTGNGSLDTAAPSSPGGMTPSLPAGVSSNGDDTVPVTPPGIGQVTSGGDPVRRKVTAVTAAVASANPGLPRGECERVARLVVGRYLREADLTDSVMSDAPMPSGQQDGGGQGGSSGGGGGLMSHVLEGQGLRSMIPGMGGGGAGAAAGAGALEEAAPLLAL